MLGVLAAAAEIPLTDDIGTTASTLTPVELRTLDAIHLPSALTLGDELAGVLTYDERMQRRRRDERPEFRGPASTS